MHITFKDYGYIIEFMNNNKGKLSEAQMADVIKAKLDAELASEVVVEQFMFQSKPRLLLGERLIAHFGNKQAALDGIPELINSHTLEELEELFGFSVTRNKVNN